MKRETKAALLATLAVVVFWTLAIYTTFAIIRTIPPEPVAEVVKPPTVQELLKLVNEERAKVGVAPLAIDERLNESAQFKADDMVTNDYISHEDRNGKHGYEYAQEATGESCSLVGENYYWGTGNRITSTAALDGWMNSKSHHDAILEDEYELTGFGIAGTDKIVVVEHFCVPN